MIKLIAKIVATFCLIQISLVNVTTASVDALFTCPSDGFFPLSPDACSNNFYTCIGGEAFLSRCPIDAIFDPIIKACVPPDQASCTPDFVCPSPGGFFPVGPGVCSNNYWTCVAGNAYLSSCPGTSVFDPALVACIPIEISACAPESTSTTSSTTSSTTTVTGESSSTSTTISSTSTTTKNPGGGFVCPGDGRFPNPDDCHSFYTCIGGIPYLQNCPPDDNLVFNPNLEVCDYPQNVPNNPCQ